MSHSKYSYEKHCPLKDPSKEIRILEIINNDRDPVECKLVRNQGGKYAALSWRWGNLEDTGEIRIIHSSQLYTFSVPTSLVPAIRALRSHGVFKVWIDFVCMDQGNINEKNYQVPMMSNIYRGSYCVYVWLGEEYENSKMAMDFVRNRVLNLRDFDRLVRDNRTVKEWQALSALMKRSWFSRRWVVQEIAIAKEAILLCGMEQIEWRNFADAISLFNEVETSTRTVSEVMKGNKDLGHMPDFFGELSELSATKLVEETNNLFRQSSRGERQAQFSLEYLVSKLIAFDATQPRDTIYALLALARDTVPVTTYLRKETVEAWTWPDYIKERLVKLLAETNVSKPYHVDYQLPLSDVYVQFVKWAITKSDKSRALDIICRPWAPVPESPSGLSDENEEEDGHWRMKTWSDPPRKEGEDTLPSWIPTVARAAFGMDGTGQRMTRKNADSLVGLPPQRVYTAAGTRVLTDNFRIEDGVTKYSDDERLNGLHYHSMFVEGIILGEVEELRYPSQQGNIPSDWIKMAKRREPGVDMPDEFWRTLVADRSPTGENARRHYGRLVQHALKQGMQGDTLNTQSIVNWGNCSPVGDVLRRVQSVIWNRKMMCTEKNQRLGLAPQYSRKGDMICILYGCSVPVLLRKFTKTDPEVEEEKRQREEKQERMRKEREEKAARKIVQVWRDILTRRQAQSRAQVASPDRKRKRAYTKKITSRKKQHRESNSQKGTTEAPSGSSSTSSTTGRGADREVLKSDPKTYYQLIGECYVDGMMNGEALSRLQSSVLFEIR